MNEDSKRLATDAVPVSSGLDSVLLADAFSGMVHELNNHLNAIVLQAATLKLTVPAENHPSLDVIRQEGIHAAGLLRPLQQLRHDQRTAQVAEISQVLADVVAAAPAGSCTLDAAVRPASGQVPAAVLRRLVTYLLHCMLTGDARVRIALDRPGEDFRLTFHVTSAQVLEDNLSALLLQADGQSDVSLWLFGIRSLLRLLGAQISVDRPGEREMTVTLQWTPEA